MLLSPAGTTKRGKNLSPKCGSWVAEAEFIRADVRDEEEVRKLIDKTVERFGRLDVAVNNAGHGRRAWPGYGTNR